MTDLSQQSHQKQPLQGSYAEEDCLYLLKPITPDYTTVADKERLIQSGQLHYSEMIHKELAPSDTYKALFFTMTARYKERLAREVMRLAAIISQQQPGRITLLSLARAGTPIGVLLQRALTHFYARDSQHYSISIIRDRGIDEQALDYVLAQGVKATEIVFVDGWTAKGVITQELRQSIKAYNDSRHVHISPALYVISDIGGTADFQATFDDYTIPSGLLNSTVSGLISRSILNDAIGQEDFHGCVMYEHLRAHDVSQWFVDEVFSVMQAGNLAPKVPESTQSRYQKTQSFLQRIAEQYRISDINRIKPGIAEATRVLLRRVPDLLLLRQLGHEDTLHLECLAREKGVNVECVSDMPLGACALIKDIFKQD